MNVYEMYYKNEKKFGFWIQRDSWAYVIAKVVEIKGVKEGENIPGVKPYFSNPIVIAEFYKTVENMNFAEIKNPKKIFLEKNNLSCPGTYAYKMIEIIEN